MDISWKTLYTAEFMITALTFLFKARYLSEKTFKAHFHVVPRAHHKLHLSASFIFKQKGPLCVEMGCTRTLWENKMQLYVVNTALTKHGPWLYHLLSGWLNELTANL